MQTPRVQIFMVLLLLGTTVGLGQNRSGSQLNITGAGARAAGMGGAFIGVADDATAIVWNPAGLTQLERMEASVVGRYVWETTEFTDKSTPKNNNTQSQTHPVFNFGSFAIPFSMGQVKGVIAAAYQRQLDFYGKQADSTVSIDETGGADTFSPGVAIGISSIFSAGLAANIWFGHNVYTTTSLPSQNELSLDGTPSGVNFLVGVLVDLDGLRKPIPIRIGACFRTPFDLKSDYSFSAKPPDNSISALKGSTTQQMPLMIGVGLSARPWENLTLSVDYETRKYGDRKNYVSVTSPTTSFHDTSDISQSKSDINQIRAGIEYLIVTRGGVFPLRAGYQNVPTLLANYAYDQHTSTYQPGDQTTGKGFSVGTGFISNSLALDLTYTWQQYEQTVTNGGNTLYSSLATVSAVTGSLIIYF
jgi:long-subunit fatty acid transport protein